jgi:AcrR family transcriptional regulator
MAATTTQRAIEGDKAQRIVDAMRASVARRGATGSTFDHVAREAGVSRGLLHYYFGTKERLLAEVVRRDCDLRMRVLDDQLADAGDADEIVAALVASLQSLVRDDPEFIVVVFELFTLSRRNEEIAAEFAETLRRTRAHVAGLLEAKQDEGAVTLRAAPLAVADVLFAMADGIALRMLAEPDRSFAEAIEAGERAVRALLA